MLFRPIPLPAFNLSVKTQHRKRMAARNQCTSMEFTTCLRFKDTFSSLLFLFGFLNRVIFYSKFKLNARDFHPLFYSLASCHNFLCRLKVNPLFSWPGDDFPHDFLCPQRFWSWCAPRMSSPNLWMSLQFIHSVHSVFVFIPDVEFENWNRNQSWLGFTGHLEAEQQIVLIRNSFIDSCIWVDSELNCFLTSNDSTQMFEIF